MKQLLLSFSKWLPSSTDNVATAYLPKRSTMMEYDQALVWVTIGLMLFGVVMVYSASISLPDSPKYANYKNAHFLIRQSIFVLISVLAGLLVFRVRISTWQKAAPYLFVLTLIFSLTAGCAGPAATSGVYKARQTGTEQAAPVVSELTFWQQHNLQQQRQQIDDLLARRLGVLSIKHTRADLPVLQQLIDQAGFFVGVGNRGHHGCSSRRCSERG